MSSSDRRRGIVEPISKRISALAFVLTGSALATACGQDNSAATLRALEPAGDATVVCFEQDAENVFTRSFSRNLCPDFVNDPSSDQYRRPFALVTQPRTGEVALVDLLSGGVVDFEPSQPGFSFMPVGAEPDVIVSTPGGAASFVSVTETGREGIFGLPSTCVGTRPETAPLRDIRTWPACRLPVAPGPMLVLGDPAIDHDGDPATPARVRASCDADYVDPAELVGQSPAAQRAECFVDLAAEGGLPGTRKLAVALPSLSEIWILDAQTLLDRSPGSFDACVAERRVPLNASVPELTQELPADLVPSSPSCVVRGLNHGPIPTDWQPRPIDFALGDDGRLFVADSDVPKVHVLDVNDPCAVTDMPALRPLSFSDPTAQITTRRLAVSPLTAQGKRFVYAVDDSGTDTAGSLMAFDVSPNSSERTPIVRPRAEFNPDELPDRITPARNVADVEFVYQDVTEDGGTAAGPRVEGVFCDPDPRLPEQDPGARYRPDDNFRSGARPTQLRGTFAFAALHTGQMLVIDVEDLDAACRRPISINPDPEQENLFGCRNDDPALAPNGFLLGNTQTVTGELSCNVVTPHRSRSRGFFSNSLGQPSASLIAFPTLTLQTGRSAATDQSDDGRDQPKMLGARHDADPFSSEQLFIGPLIYDTNASSNRLELDPGVADRSSLLLSFEEPRAFAPEEFLATYEGAVRAPSPARFYVDPNTGLGVIDEGLNASFCSGGVQDVDVTIGVGRDLGVTGNTAEQGFALRHADYAQLIGELLGPADAYWSGAGASCGTELFESDAAGSARQSGRRLCEDFFGSPAVPTLRRDLRVVEASEDRLLVEPRVFERISETRRRLLLEFVGCCFPEPAPFVVRAGHQWVVDGSGSGVRNHIAADPDSGRCVADCSPARRRLNSRVFEISCSENCPLDERGRPPIGVAPADAAFACVVDDGAAGGVVPGEPGSECVFQNLTSRFAIYRGRTQSARGMRFRWQLGGGFAPAGLSLVNSERVRSTPRGLTLVPEIERILVTDGSAAGITLVSPRTLTTGASIF